MKAYDERAHYIKLPLHIYIGNGIIDSLGHICDQMNAGEPFFVFMGEHVQAILRQRVERALGKFFSQIDFVAVKEATIEAVNEITRSLKRSNAATILGVGGGKTIDVAKVVAHRLNADFVSVPTAASHDGIASPYASIKGLEKTYSIKTDVPLGIVADIDVIKQAPAKLTSAGVGDIIAKFTAVKDWMLAHRLKGERYGDYAASLALLSAKMVSQNAEAIRNNLDEGIRILVEAEISCGVAMCIAGSSRPCSGSEHLFSHALDKVANYPSLHGWQVGVGSIMMSYLWGLNWRRIREILEKVGAATNYKDLGVSKQQIIKALSIAHTIRPERYTILGESGLSEGAAERLAKRTNVID